MAKKGTTAKMLAVLGRSRRTGRWRVAKTTNVLALLGACKIDMSDAVIDDEQLKMKITVLFGSASIVLPEGALVQPSGISFLSSSIVDVSDDVPEGDVPTISVECMTVFGRSRIRHPNQEAASEEQVPDEVAPLAGSDDDPPGAPAGEADTAEPTAPEPADTEPAEPEPAAA